MSKTMTLAVTAVALAMAGCAKKSPPPAPPPPISDTTGADESEVGLQELPRYQAEMIAAAGSDSVYFATDRSDLDSAARATLAAQARWMNANPAIRASIEGHCDERGTREYNLALGERRASAARDFLISHGIDPGRLMTISWGKERPVALGSDDTAWARNRRAVTVLVR